MGTQAVILAGGKGTRMMPLTMARPKPLQEVLGKNLLEWKLEALPPEIADVIIVVGHMREQIEETLGHKWGDKTIRYIVQHELNGTGGALLCAKPLLGERFLVMMVDDSYGKDDIAKLLPHEWAIGVVRVHQKEIGAEMIVNDDGTFRGIKEEKHFVEDGLVNTGLYMLSRDILDIPLVPIPGKSNEYGLPHALAEIAKSKPVHLVLTEGWTQITTAEDIARAEKLLHARSVLYPPRNMC